MKLCKRINVLFLLIVLTVILCSCQNHYDDINKRFEKYSSDCDVVAVLDDCTFYFFDHMLDLRDLVNENEAPNQGYLFLDNALYFSTTKENGLFDYSISIYRCDIYGNNKTLIFEKHGYKTHPWSVGNQDTLYFEHYSTNAFDVSAKVIESYNVITEVYEQKANSEDVSLSDYQKDKSVDSKINVTHIIDKTKEQFSEALTGLDYSYSASKFLSGRLFIIYRIEEPAGGLYPHFICEYVPETDEVNFKSLVFTYDMEFIDVEYLK